MQGSDSKRRRIQSKNSQEAKSDIKTVCTTEFRNSASMEECSATQENLPVDTSAFSVVTQEPPVGAAQDITLSANEAHVGEECREFGQRSYEAHVGEECREFASLWSLSEAPKDDATFVSMEDASAVPIQSTISEASNKLPEVSVTDTTSSSSCPPLAVSVSPAPFVRGDKSPISLGRCPTNPPTLPVVSGLLTDPAQTSRRSGRRSRRSPAQKRWQEVGRRVGVARKVVNAFTPQESKYFGYARVVSHILADNFLYWPLRDATCQLSVLPFTSFCTMVDWRQTLRVVPLHMLEEICENFFDQRDELENRNPPPWKKAKLELGSTLVSFILFSLRVKALLGRPLMGSPVSFLYGAFSRIAMVLPFFGGYGVMVPFSLQTTWLATMFMPLNGTFIHSVYREINDVAAAQELYSTHGVRGFYRGAFATTQTCCSSIIAHLLVDFEISNKLLAAGLALSCALWANDRSTYLADIGYLSATSFATAFVKKTVRAFFGPPPKRLSMTDVQLTRDFIELRTIANEMTNRLSRRAEEEEFYADVHLEEKEDDLFCIQRSVSVSTLARTVSGFLRQSVKSKHVAAAFFSGLHGDLYFLNGRYDAELDRDRRPLIENGRPKYHRMLNVEMSEDDEELSTGDFAYLYYVVAGASERWVLVHQDKTTVVAFCNDPAVYPFQVKAPWFVYKDEELATQFVEDGAAKVSREPTPFLHRMNVFSLLNQMLDNDECSESDMDTCVDRAVEPAERFVLRIRRDSLAKNSLQSVLGCLPSDLVAHEFLIEFKGECGLDYGGLTREWFSLLASELTKIDDLEMQLWDMKIDREGPWFNCMPDNTLLPCEDAPVQFYLAVGRLLAMALIHGSFFPLPLSFVIFKYILESPITDEDLKVLDPDFYKHRLAILLKDKGADTIAEMLGEPLTFVSAASPRSLGERPLIIGGEDVHVTEHNKLAYAKLLSEEFLCGNIRQQLQALVTGFWDLCPRKALSAMTAKDLKILTVGHDEPFDIGVFSKNAKCQAVEANPVQFEWFLYAVTKLSPEESVRFLQFFTGASRMPQDGLSPPFTLIINAAWDMAQLPTAHTCANTVCIPAYASYELLARKLHTALEFNVGFGFE